MRGVILTYARKLSVIVLGVGLLLLGILGYSGRASGDFGPPQGMDGPDHFYAFSLTEKTRVETGVASNNSYWSARGPLRSPW